MYLDLTPMICPLCSETPYYPHYAAHLETHALCGKTKTEDVSIIDLAAEIKAEKYAWDRLVRPVIYILGLNNKIVYIGITKNIFNKLNAHKRDKEFNQIYLRELDFRWHREELEKALIRAIKPKYNKAIYDGGWS